MAAVVSPVRQFNDALKSIFEIFAELPSKKFKAGLAIRALREQLLKGISAQPEYTLVLMGPHLVSCCHDIESGDAKRILGINHVPYILQLSREHGFDAEDAAKCVAFMKDAYNGAPPSERVRIISCCRTMLGAYARYRLR